MIDSGASQHICGTSDCFASYRPVTGKAVSIANGHRIPAVGCGDINVDIQINGRTETGVFRDVLHAPGMAYNLLSVTRLTEGGLNISFTGKDCVIRLKEGRVIGHATRKAGTTSMYVIHVRPHAGVVRAIVATEPTLCHDNLYAALADLQPQDSQSPSHYTSWQVAHLRMGHLHSKALAQLPAMATDAEWVAAGAKGPVLPCEGCLRGKSHREAMPSASTQRATKPLELVRSDVCGPFSTESLGGFSYFVLFIDDFSRFIVVFPIAYKSDVLSRFLIFHAWAERLTGARLRTLRTDGGGEYGSREFDQYLSDKGIARQRTPPYTPQHNGIAERANRTLMEEVRALLISSSMPNRFWALALQAAVYLRNRSPTRTLTGMTPYEAFTGRRPSLSGLRVWGCLVYVHIPKQKRSGKLGPRSTPCIFVGYSQQSKAYLVWDPALKAVVTSRDVTFMEHLRGSQYHLLSTTADSPLIADAGEDSDDVNESDLPRLIPPPRINKAIARGGKGVPSTTMSVTTRQRVAEAPATQWSGSNTGVETNPRAGNLSFSHFIQELNSDRPDVDPEDRLPLSHFLNQAPRPSADSHALYAATETTDTTHGDPASFKEAMRRDDHVQWKQAAQEEFDSIQSAGTWTLTPLPSASSSGRTAIGCKWVFKVKRKADGSIDRYKARVVAKGYAQKEGVDYTETFAPVAKFSAIRALLSLSAFYDLELHQMDVKCAFLNGDLDHEIYMTQPEGFVTSGKQDLVCKLQRTLYGLKQAGRSWNQKIDDTLQELGFTVLKSDSCLYVYGKISVVIFIALYVDDLLLASTSKPALTRLKADLVRKFSMKDLGEAQYMLGLQIQRNRTARTLSISQGEYVRHILARFGMWDSKPVHTPLEISAKLTKADCPGTDATPDVAFTRLYQSAVGAIMYAMLGTRPDIAFAVTALSQFNSNPGQAHWIAVKHVMRYLRGTVDYQLTYGASGTTAISPVVYGYSDSDWGSNTDDRRSVTGYVFLLGGGAVSWQARKQTTVALSSVEAEYMAATQSTKEAMWWRSTLSELGVDLEGPTVIHSDSQGSIALTKNPEHHARSKHIDIRHHFVREQVAVGTIAVDYVPTEEMVADVLTKALPRDKHHKLINMMGVHSPSSAVGVLELAD